MRRGTGLPLSPLDDCTYAKEEGANLAGKGRESGEGQDVFLEWEDKAQSAGGDKIQKTNYY